MSRRNERISVAIISEGETEAWYFKQLSTVERIHISTYPKEGITLNSLFEKALDLLEEGSYNFIFGLVDLDVLKDDKTKLQKLENLSKDNLKNISKFYLIKSQPCFEYWFYLHKEKYSSKFFSTWENVNPLKPEIKKIFDKYEKSNKYYRSISGRGIYSSLRPKLINAGKNSIKLFNEKNTETVCEIFYVVGVLFCSKCREQNCSDGKFFDECIKSKHLCDNLEKELTK
ncbi:MAG: RloB domain-containing protein [Armatimonadetes bacterium]|nr:RloB domain-containing protein [Armatimonadota bacterium]